MIGRLLHHLRCVVDWRAAAVDEWEHRGAAVMLDEVATRPSLSPEAIAHINGPEAPKLRYRLGDSDGTWNEAAAMDAADRRRRGDGMGL